VADLQDGGEVVNCLIKTYLHNWTRAGHLDGFEVSVSIGVTEWVDGKTLDEVLDTADREMYAEKEKAATQLAMLLPKSRAPGRFARRTCYLIVAPLGRDLCRS
jgi:GGDEF domain-containing protein